jgi:hypothetical protein
MQLSSVLTNCTLCLSPVGEAIDKLLRDGRSAGYIQNWLREGGYKTVHRNTISTHKTKHLTAERQEAREEVAEQLADRVRRERPTNNDLAVLVRDRAVERIVNGDMDVTTAEGLRAQELIDRRAERSDGEQVVLAIAIALSGSRQYRSITEGQYRELPSGDE